MKYTTAAAAKMIIDEAMLEAQRELLTTRQDGGEDVDGVYKSFPNVLGHTSSDGI